MLEIAPHSTLPAGQIVALGVSAEDFMTDYADSHHEWVKGVVIKMSPSTQVHNRLVRFLDRLLDTYLALRPIGQTFIENFVLQLDETIREPDVMLILNDNPGELREAMLIGPADICIEVVSEESRRRDYGDKYVEYEQAGVREYWIVDPMNSRAVFHRRRDTGSYEIIMPDADGRYRTPLLPGFALPVGALWDDPLPDMLATVAMVKAMLDKSHDC